MGQENNGGNIVSISDARWTYTKEDFLMGTAPYEELYALREDPFTHRQTVEAMADYANSIGFRAFKKTYNEYVRSQNGVAVNFGFSNVTDFTGQSMELETGPWEANDLGVADGDMVACSHPIMPVERLVNIDTGVEKLRLAFKRGATWRQLIAEKSVLASRQKILALADQGVSVNSETAANLVRYISDTEDRNYDKLKESKSIGRLGFIPGEGFSPYVEGLIFDGDANFRELFRSVRSAGSEEAWTEMARECRKMSLTARIILAASFASPLLEILGALPFFVHLWGVDSGTGKTVALMLAASVWGDPTIGSYIKTFDATVVGHEKTAAFLNHLPLCLDELQLAKNGKGQTNFDVYKLAQGVGRTRGNRSGGVDRTPTWRNCILTTGESPLTSSGAGAGAVNRVIDIECKASDAVITDGMRVANTLKANFGFAGRRFVEAIYSSQDAMNTIRESYQMFYKELSRQDTTEKQAMAAAAIMTADKLATQMFFRDGLGLMFEEVGAFLASKAAVSAGERGYQYLMDWIAQNSTRFLSESEDAPKTEILGVLEISEAFVIRSVFDQAMSDAGYSPSALLSWLKENGKIRVRKKNRTLGKRINGILRECVCVLLPSDEGEADDDELLPY